MRRRLEDDIQRAVVAHIRTRGVSGLCWFHPPNGGARTRAEGAIFKGLGVQPGVSDLIFFFDGVMYALELKTPKRQPTEAQRQFMRQVVNNGGRANWARSVNEAVGVLEHWGLLRGAMQNG